MAEIDDLVEAAGGAPAQRAQSAIIAGMDKDPEAASRAYGISAEIGVPPQTVYEDLKGFEQEVKERKARQQLEQAPAVSNFIAGNPNAAPIAADDVIALQNFNDQVQNIDSMAPPESLTAGIAQGWQHHEYASDAAAYQFGFGQEDRLKAYEAERAREAQLGGVDAFLSNLGNLLGTTAGSAVAALSAAGAGAAVGAGVGGLPGAAAGAVGGAVYGFLADIVYTGSGETYRALDLARDRNGNPLPEATKQTAALASGFAMAAIMRVAPESLAAPLRALVGEAVVNAVADPAVSSFLAHAGIAVAKAGLTGGALNVAFNWAQTIPQELAKWLSAQPFETIFTDPDARQRFLQQTTDALINGAALFAVMAVPGIGLHPLIDLARISQAQIDAAQIGRAMDAAEATKMKGRAPELLETLVCAKPIAAT
jgi:hypothetical protein